MRGVDHLRRREAPSGRHLEPPQLREMPGVLLVDGEPAGENGRIGPHLRPALHARVPADRHEAAVLPPHEPFGQSEVDDGPDVVLAAFVLGDAHGPHEDRGLRLPQHPGKLVHVCARRAGERLELLETLPAQLALELLESDRVVADEGAVDPAVLHHVLEGPAEERDVPAHVHQEEPVGDPGAEDRALQVGRHPVPVHPGLPVGVDHRDLRSSLPGVIEVLHGDRLVVRHVRSDEHHQVAPDPVEVGAGAGRDPQGLLQAERARGVAHSRGVVDGVAPQGPEDFLGDVVVLIWLPPAGHVEAESVGQGRPDPFGDEVQRLVPGDPPEARLAPPADHRVWEPPKGPELGAPFPPERFEVGEHGDIQGRHSVEPEQPEPHVAQVDLVEGPVAEPGGPQRTPVADSVPQDPPSERQVVAVLP